MAFSQSSFFIGVGTVVLTMAAGFGGSVLLTDVLVGKQEPRAPSRLEQRAAQTGGTAAAAEATPAQIRTIDVSQGAAAQPQAAMQPVPPQSVSQDAFAAARDTDLQRDTRRQEQTKKAERRRSAERKQQRRLERMMAERARRQQPADEVDSGRNRVADAPRLDPFQF